MLNSITPRIWKNGNYARLIFKDTIIGGIRKTISTALGKIIDLPNHIFKHKDLGTIKVDMTNGNLIPLSDQEYLQTAQQNVEIQQETSVQHDIKKQAETNTQQNTMNQAETNTQQNTMNQAEINVHENSDKNLMTSDQQIHNFTYGDTINLGLDFAIAEIIRKSRLEEVIRETLKDKVDSDTFIVLMIASLVKVGSANQIKDYYDNSILSFLYPKAKVTSQDISRFYSKMSKSTIETDLLYNHKKYLFNTCGLDGDFNLDSTGRSCNTKAIIEVGPWNHDGDVGYGIRIGLVDHSIGMPIMYFNMFGNAHDATTINTTFNKLQALGIEVKRVRFDNAYMSDSAIEQCYDKRNVLIHDYITRLKKNSRYATKYLKNGVDFLKTPKCRHFYNGRELFITREEIYVGENSDKPAYLYIIYDPELYHTEYEKAKKSYLEGEISEDEYDEKMKTLGIFCLLSGEKYGCDVIVHEYLKRVGIETTIRSAKNYLSLFPVRVHNDDTFYGKMLVGFYSLVTLRVIQFTLKRLDLDNVSIFKKLSRQFARVYENSIIIECKNPKVNDIYEQLGIVLPDIIKIEPDGSLNYDHAEVDDIPQWVINATQEQPYSSGPSKKVAEKKNTTTKKNTVSPKDTHVSDKLQSQPSPTKSTPGRPLGSRNEKTKKREELVHTLNEILRIKREDAGVSDEDLKEMQEESTKKNLHFHGRKKGSKNKSTERMELLKQQASRFIDALAEKFSMTRTDIINLIVYQSKCPPAPKHNGRGRPKGTLNAATVEKKAIQCLIESSLNPCLEHTDIQDVNEDDLKSLASDVMLNSSNESKSLSEDAQNASVHARGRRKGVKNASTLVKEANMDKAYRWLDEFCVTHSMSREAAIKRLWMQNRNTICPGVTASESHTRGRRKGSFGEKRIEKEVVKYISSSILTQKTSSDN